jgi:hypothetical protein
MWRYLITSKHFRWGLALSLLGAIGIAVFGVFRIAAFQYYGLITLPYTTPIDDFSTILFFCGLPVAELLALLQWDRESKANKVQEEVAVEEPVSTSPVAIPVIANLVFVDHEASLMFGDAIAHLPPMKNEHYLCRAMFKHRINEPVDWSLPYEEMTGDMEIQNHEKAKRMVYDTTKSLNDRARKHLGIDSLFAWEGKTIKRTK